MFRPNQRARYLARIGRDRHAREVYAEPVEIGVGIVSLGSAIQKTTVRSDSSGSRGAAEETATTGVFLVASTVTARRDDMIEFMGESYRILRAEPRFTSWGKLDHFEIAVGAPAQ